MSHIRNLETYIDVYSDVGNYREQNEDTYLVEKIIVEDRIALVFAIFDGHGGDECSYFLKDNFSNYLEMSLVSLDNGTAVQMTISEICELIDKDFLNTFSTSFAGSCALIGLLYDHPRGGYNLVTTNVGDSIAILAKEKEGKLTEIQLNRLHKPSDPEERAYLEATGHKVRDGRFLGLAVSRAFGDKDMKDKGLKCEPEFTTHHIDSTDHFFIFASDGLWDVVSFDTAIELVKMGHDAESLANFALNSGSTDNVTVIIGRFEENEES